MSDIYHLTLIALTGAFEVDNDIVIKAPKQFKNFIGQPFNLLEQWINKQGSKAQFQKVEE